MGFSLFLGEGLFSFLGVSSFLGGVSTFIDFFFFYFNFNFY